MLLAHPRRDRLKRAPAKEQLEPPEGGRQYGRDVELGEIAVWHLPGREVVEQAGGIPSRRPGPGARRGRTRAIDEEARAQGGREADGEGLRGV